MTPGQAQAAYDKLKGDIREHNSRLPQINAGSASGYNAEANALNAQKAALERKLGARETVPAQLSRLVTDWAQPGPEGPPARPPKLDLSTPHAEELATDPGNGGKILRWNEAETALRVEAQRGIHLVRSPHEGVDFIDPVTGETYEAVGNSPAEFLNLDKFLGRIKDHTDKADYVPVDISTFSAEQRSIIRRFVDGLGNPRVFIVGDYGSS
jgi:hypothetical protein